MSNSENDDLRPEYDREELGAGVRGKYHKAYQESTNVVVVDPDLRCEFPNSKAVNDAFVRSSRAAGGHPNHAFNPTPKLLRNLGSLRAARSGAGWRNR